MSDVIENDTRNYYDPMFCGTENYSLYSPFGPASMGLKITDSVVHFAKEKKAWWTLDVIYSYLPEIVKVLKEADSNIIFLHFDVKDSVCDFYAQLDSGMPKLFQQHIEFTDLATPIMLYLQDDVLMFPSDY